MKRKAETEVGPRNKISKEEEEEVVVVVPDDVTVLPPGSEIKRGSLTQVPRESPTTSLDPQWKIVKQLGGTLSLQLARTEEPLAGENIHEELLHTAVQDDGDGDGDSEQAGPADAGRGLCNSSQAEGERLNDVEEIMRNNNALWDVYFKT